MKKNDTIFAIIWLVLGLPLIGLSIAGLVDEFWSGMGSALVVIGACRLLRAHRLNKNEEYREKMETYATDERLHFLRARAWSWAGTCSSSSAPSPSSCSGSWVRTCTPPPPVAPCA